MLILPSRLRYPTSSVVFRLLRGALPILQFSCGCSSLYPLVSKPAFNLHASMPVESKPMACSFLRKCVN